MPSEMLLYNIAEFATVAFIVYIIYYALKKFGFIELVDDEEFDKND